MAADNQTGNPKSWSCTYHIGDLANRLNEAKTMTLRTLVAEGYLSKEKALEFDSEYALSVRMQGWWGQMIDKLHGPNKIDTVRYQFIKVLDVPPALDKVTTEEIAEDEKEKKNNRFRDIL